MFSRLIKIFLIILAIAWLSGVTDYFKKPEHPIKVAMEDMGADNDPEAIRQRAEVIARFIPYGMSKDESIRLLSEAGFEVFERPQRVVTEMQNRGIEVEEAYGFTIRHGWIVTTTYAIRLGYMNNAVVYISPNKSITGP